MKLEAAIRFAEEDLAAALNKVSACFALSSPNDVDTLVNMGCIRFKVNYFYLAYINAHCLNLALSFLGRRLFKSTEQIPRRCARLGIRAPIALQRRNLPL